LSLSGFPIDGIQRAAGHDTFATYCTACHGADGKGNPVLGAPNLTDKTWLHGGSNAKVVETITNGRQSHMPAHKSLLDEAKINLLSAYVYGLSHDVQAMRAQTASGTK
jgi:cytochrome c oxidase cbb3-type subunit 3